MSVTGRHTMPGADLGLCLFANRLARRHAVLHVFAAFSRLGDGWFWYALMVVLPLVDGERGLRVSLHLAALGLVTLVMYRAIKQATRRARPYAAHARIRAWVAPLDEYSFPSGHTLHAVAFTAVTLVYYPNPGMVILLTTFSTMVALSRVVLGLHYPSDVVAAIGLGSLLASASFAIA